eukprot:11522281-Alexandrium_andersonii.AAC.1
MRTRRSLRGTVLSNPRARAAPAASASSAPVPTGKVRVPRVTSQSCALPSRSHTIAAAPAGSSAAGAPEPSKVTMSPVARAGPVATVRLGSGRRASPALTGWLAV